MTVTYTYSGNIYDSSAAGTDTFALTSSAGNSISFLQKAHIHVYLSDDDGKTWVEKARPSEWDFDATCTSVVLATGITAGQWVRVLRLTPFTNRFVDFADGSLLTAGQLDQGEDFSRYVDQELSDHLLQIDGGTGGATSFITEEEATKDPTDPAWEGDESLASAGAIDRIYAQVLGNGLAYPGTGNKGKDGKLRIDTTGSVPKLYFWDAGTEKWIDIATQGSQGPKGDKGDAATIAVGSTVTTAPGTDASVTNTGTTSAAVFDFEIPRGEKGPKGDKGDDGGKTQADWNETSSSSPAFIKNKPPKPDLGYTKASDKGTVTIAGGNDAVIPAADTSNAGLLTAADKVKLDGLSTALVYKGVVDLTGSTIPSPGPGDTGWSYANSVAGTASKAWADVASGLNEGDSVDANDMVVWNGTSWNFLKNSFEGKGQTDLTWAPSSASGEVQSSTGANATIPAVVSDGDAGLMTGADKRKLDNIASGAEVNVPTNLTHDKNDTQVTVKSSTGGNTTIDAADATSAGVMSKDQAIKLDGIPADANKNVQADWNVTNSSSDAFIKNKPAIGSAPNDGKMEITAGNGLQKDSGSAAEFTANQSADTQMTFEVKAADSTIGVSASGIKVEPGQLGITSANDGQINVNAGNGLEATGTNATANQSGNTTRTLSVKASNSTIKVEAGGISVDTANIGMPPAPNNGQININGGNGIDASGSNATANQSSNTTRTLSINDSYINTLIDAKIPTGGNYVEKTGDTMSGNLTLPTLNGLVFPKTTGEGGDVNTSNLTGGECLIWGKTFEQIRIGSYIENTELLSGTGSPSDIQGNFPGGNDPGTLIAGSGWLNKTGYNLVIALAHGSVKFGQDGANFQARLTLEANPGGNIAKETVQWEQRGAEWKGGAFSLQGIYRLDPTYNYKVKLSIAKDRGTGTATPAAGSIRCLFLK